MVHVRIDQGGAFRECRRHLLDRIYGVARRVPFDEHVGFQPACRCSGETGPSASNRQPPLDAFLLDRRRQDRPDEDEITVARVVEGPGRAAEGRGRMLYLRPDRSDRSSEEHHDTCDEPLDHDFRRTSGRPPRMRLSTVASKSTMTATSSHSIQLGSGSPIPIQTPTVTEDDSAVTLTHRPVGDATPIVWPSTPACLLTAEEHDQGNRDSEAAELSEQRERRIKCSNPR